MLCLSWLSRECFLKLVIWNILNNFQHIHFLHNYGSLPQGPLFPGSIIVPGITLAVSKKLPTWQCILFSLAGAAFPVSRIARNQTVAHLADLLFLVACTSIAISFLKRRSSF